MRVVYGGSSVGLMGELADAALLAGGEVVGVIPQLLVDKEIAHMGLTELHVVGTMHERKARMAELADGFVTLPGGYGTLDELAEVLTASQLGLHLAPCGLLDVGGYFCPLLEFFDLAVEAGFLNAEHRDLVVVDSEPDRLLDEMTRWRRPNLSRKWDPRPTDGHVKA